MNSPSIKEAASFIEQRCGFHPELAIILGTGMSHLTSDVSDSIEIPYKDIPGFPISTAPSHKGSLLLGNYANKKIMIMQGRLHYYEGYSMEQVTFPIRTMKELGVKQLIVTNAAGSLNKDLQTGDIVVLDDHINFMGINPLVGQHNECFGARFPSMNEPYSARLKKLIETIASKYNITIKKGVYIAVSGPSLETKSECKAFASWGADLVGMSTVPETIVAIQSGIEVLGVSVVTNMSNLFHSEVHSQSDIETAAATAYHNMNILLQGFISAITTV